MRRFKFKLVAACLALLAIGGFIALFASRTSYSKVKPSKAATSPEHSDIAVRSLFPKLEVTQVSQVAPETVRFALRNGYKKDITAIVSSVGDPDKIMRRDYIYAELEESQTLASGQSDNFLYSVTPPGREIVIISILFRDMTIEGNKDEIGGILEVRRGVKIQFARVKPYVQDIDKIEGSMISQHLAALKRVAEGTPLRTDDGSTTSGDLAHGLRFGQSLILKHFSELENAFTDATFYALDGSRVTKTKEERFREKSAEVKKWLAGLERRL